jgi:anti-sigma factor RsiW
MSELNCEDVGLATMALSDGAASSISAEAVENHLAQCRGCREEVAQQRALTALLNAQKRRNHTEDIWAVISPAIIDDAAGPAVRSRKKAATTFAFVFLGVLLLSFRLAELLPKTDPGLLIKFAPLLLVAAVFAYLKENPFKVNASLRLEGE